MHSVSDREKKRTAHHHHRRLSSELCSASVRTFGERVVRRNDDHLHGRTLRVDPQQEFLSRLKKRAAEDTVTIPRIYDEELARSVDEHSPDIRSHLPSFSSVKSTLYRHRQRGQRNQASKGIKTEPTADCKSSAGHPTGWNTLPPKKRPLTVNVDCLPTPSPSSCCSSSSYSHLSSESHQAEKRRKHSSSSSTTTTTAPATTTFTEENHQNNNSHMAVAAALESQQLIAKFLSNPYNLLLAQNYFAKYSTSFADNPHFMLMHAYALVLSSLQQQQQPLMWYSLFLLFLLFFYFNRMSDHCSVVVVISHVNSSTSFVFTLLLCCCCCSFSLSLLRRWAVVFMCVVRVSLSPCLFVCVCWTFRHTVEHWYCFSSCWYYYYYYYYCGCQPLPSHLNVWCVCLYCAIYFPWLMHSFIHSRSKSSFSLCVPFGFFFSLSLFVRSRFLCVLAFERIFLMFLAQTISFLSCCRQIHIYIHKHTHTHSLIPRWRKMLASTRSADEIFIAFLSLTRTGNDSHFSTNEDMKRHNLMRVASDETQPSFRKNYQD